MFDTFGRKDVKSVCKEDEYYLNYPKKYALHA